MKKLFLVVLLSVFLNSLLHAGEKLRVAVLDPTTSGIAIDDGTKLAVQELVSSAIVNVGTYTMVERSMIEQIIKEQSFQNSDFANSDQATEIGKLAGANKVVLSAVSLVGGRNMLSIKMIDVETATVERQKTKIAGTNDLLDVVEGLTLELLGEKIAPKKVESKPKEAPKKTTNIAKKKADSDAPVLGLDIEEENKIVLANVESALANLSNNVSPKKYEKMNFASTQVAANAYVMFENGVLKIQGEGDVSAMDKKWLGKVSLSVTAIHFSEGITRICPFNNLPALQCVYLPSTLEALPESAFRGCKSLYAINIPEGVTMIGAKAFEDCKSLQRLILPNSVTFIGNNAFADCEKLSFINIPVNISILPAKVFNDCKYLNQIIIPEGVTSIGADAFNGCAAISRLYIPNSVSSIGESAFEDMKSLSDVRMSESVTTLPNKTFKDCESLKQVILPENVSRLGEQCYKGCKSMYSFEARTSRLNSIGEHCFEHCKALTTFVIHSSVAPKIEDIFEDEDDNEEYYEKITLLVQQNAIGAFTYAENWSEFSNIGVIKY